ncbi:MAG: hypothetical protein ACK46L_15640 [Synechococcaceae cyanobacterium]
MVIRPTSAATDRNAPHHDRRANQPGKSGSDLASIDQQIELRFELKLQVLDTAGLRAVVAKLREFCLEAPEGVQGFAHTHNFALANGVIVFLLQAPVAHGVEAGLPADDVQIEA